jgi:hypothetical protein
MPLLDLTDLFVLLMLVAGAAWLWRGHGIRERALARVRQYCAEQDVQLLDDNVALRRLALIADARGRRRLARVYAFEFTVTGMQRLNGSISMFGERPGPIRLDAHPLPESDNASGQVIQLDQWRRQSSGNLSKPD